MKKAFVSILLVLSLLFISSCDNGIKSNSQSFPSWLEGKTLRIKGENKRAVLTEDDNYYYVTCSGSLIYVDSMQGDISSYEEEVRLDVGESKVVATSSSTEYIFTTDGEEIVLEIKGNESLSGIYSTEETNRSNWSLKIQCYESPNQSENVACRIVITPQGLYYLLCSNYEMYKNSTEPFRCEKDKWFCPVDNIKAEGDTFTITTERGEYRFKRNRNGSITLTEGENTFILKEKSFDYNELIKNSSLIKSHYHNYVSINKVDPSCADGYEELKCECGDSYRKVFQATGKHKYVLEVQIEMHTQKNNGRGLYKCSVCGYETEEVIYHENEEVIDIAKESYFKNGKYCYQCKLCGKKSYENAHVIYRDTIKFGTFEKNGEKIDIEWLVLKEEGNDALLISKYILYSSLYAEKKEGYEKYSAEDKWDNYPLIRKELNGKYYNDFFTDEEKTKIKKDKNGDNMSLLSYGDGIVYFDDYDKLGLFYGLGYDNVYYWIRDFDTNDHPCLIRANEQKTIGVENKNTEYGVRPCIWVKDWKSLIK